MSEHEHQALCDLDCKYLNPERQDKRASDPDPRLSFWTLRNDALAHAKELTAAIEAVEEELGPLREEHERAYSRRYAREEHKQDLVNELAELQNVLASIEAIAQARR